MGNSRKYLAELVGTFALVLVGCGSAVIAGDKIGFLGISLAFGLTVLAMVYAIGPISGCHVNPAVTCGMVAAGKTKPREAVFYILAQCVGAVIAAGVLAAIASGRPGYSVAAHGLGQNGYGSASPGQFSMASAFLAEVVLTFLFLMVILGSTSAAAPAASAGLAIGLSLAFIHMVGIPITGTSVNPARSLGPAILVGGTALSQLWLFIVAPIAGAVLAALTWRHLLEKRPLAAA